MPGLSRRKYRARAFGLRLGARLRRGAADEWRRPGRWCDGRWRMLRRRLRLPLIFHQHSRRASGVGARRAGARFVGWLEVLHHRPILRLTSLAVRFVPVFFMHFEHLQK